VLEPPPPPSINTPLSNSSDRFINHHHKWCLTNTASRGPRRTRLCHSRTLPTACRPTPANVCLSTDCTCVTFWSETCWWTVYDELAISNLRNIHAYICHVWNSARSPQTVFSSIANRRLPEANRRPSFSHGLSMSYSGPLVMCCVPDNTICNTKPVNAIRVWRMIS